MLDTQINPDATVILLTDPQHRLVTTDAKFPAMVAGFGAGKTGALIKRLMAKKFEYPDLNVAYYLPTYDLVASIAIPRWTEALNEIGYEEGEDFKTISAQRPRIEIFGCGMVIFRTMDNPARIVGYEVADSAIDELDTLKTEDARNVWRKVLARNRQKKPDGKSNTIAVGTTPEGFRFVYEQWKYKPPSDDYELIPASTHSNARNLPADYISNLSNDYPPNLLMAYIEGEFVNLTSGSVYPHFDRKDNGSNETVQPGEALHIGMDFNVGKMSAVVFVRRGDDPHAVGEFTGLLDTPAMVAAIARRFPNHPIYVYPDASGGARSSNNASESDINILKAAKFVVCVNSRNPWVKDRVLSVNALILNGEGKRRLKVNTALCPSFTEALEKQAYNDKGEPDKTAGFDHAADAGGYFICYAFPVAKPHAGKAKMKGL